MKESEFTLSPLKSFKRNFQIGWIDELNWNPSNEDESLKKGLALIKQYRIEIVENYSKLLMSGNYLIRSTNSIDDLNTLIENSIADEVLDNTQKASLKAKFQGLLNDLTEIIRLTKVHISYVNEKYVLTEKKASFSFFQFPTNRDERDNLVKYFNVICEVCSSEFDFSYNETHIDYLLKLKQYITDRKDKYSGGLLDILESAVYKLDFLLCKLSVFSKNKEITYNYNFQFATIQLDAINRYAKSDMRYLFLSFLDPQRLDEATIHKWQNNTFNKKACCWQMVLLMRYYTKQTKNINQIDNLIFIAESHLKNRKNQSNTIDNYADKSFISYMYNSRFSFKCQNVYGNRYQDMKKDLEEIRTIQNQSFIYNYHPYLKAIEYTIKWIETSLTNCIETDFISNVMSDLCEYFEKFKECLEWCKKNQPFPMQSEFNISSVKFKGYEIFFPSSFCRPLKFKELEQKANKIDNKISMLEYNITHHDEKMALLKAEHKIENLEKKNMKDMGLFITITTFLVGLLSIFIGNSSSVSIFSKMEYVIALGLILLSFICVGYFMISDFLNNIKPIIFAVLLLSCIITTYVLIKKGNEPDKVIHKTIIKEVPVQNHYQESIISYTPEKSNN